MLVLEGICFLFILIGLVGLGYNLLLAGVVAGPRPAPGEASPGFEFAVVIPAHNEDACLGDLLSDLNTQTRPPSLILVVADRCTDATEELAVSSGAEVLVLDEDGGSKGAAVLRGLEYLGEREWGAVLVVDADCRVGPRLLEHCLMTPDEVVQSQVVLRAAPGGQGLIYDYLSRLENEVFHRGRARLGLLGFLRGTGMFLGRRALEQCPWRSEGLTEDRAQGFMFLSSGIRVRHDPALRVETLPPEKLEESWTQRRRWTSEGLPSHLAASIAVATKSTRHFGIRAMELPLAVVADARSQWLLLLLTGTLIAMVFGRSYVVGLSALALTGLAGTLAGLRWYGTGFFLVLVRLPVSAAISLALAALSLVGIKPGAWHRGR